MMESTGYGLYCSINVKKQKDIDDFSGNKKIYLSEKLSGLSGTAS
jgi:hypothetical protein